MSSTNKTTNYELSQFIGTDKPAWLTDYNADMSKIDTGLNTAQGTATGADTKATANASAIGTLANLTTEAKTSLVAAVNEVDTNADAAAGVAATATQTANNAYGAASTATTKVNALADYLTITSTSIPSNKIVPNNGTVSDTNMYVAQNSTHSLGKVYGYFQLNVSSASWCTVTLNYDSGIHPDADFDILCAGLANGTRDVTLRFKTNGNIQMIWYAQNAGAYRVTMLPCLYFFEDFGDVAES